MAMSLCVVMNRILSVIKLEVGKYTLYKFPDVDFIVWEIDDFSFLHCNTIAMFSPLRYE